MRIVKRKIVIKDLVLMANIGAYQSETGGRQRVRLSIELTIADPDKAIGDRLAEVVDYAEVIEAVGGVAETGHINLVETFAEKAAQACLAFPAVSAVEILVEKPDARADADSVGCRISVTR